MKEIIKKILKKAGYQIEIYPGNDLIRRMKIIRHCNINTLLDIGANDGKYAIDIREIGYAGRIVSFEPLKKAFDGLERASAKDKNWIVNNYALGNEDMKSIINVASNLVSSSILNMLPLHLKNAPESEFIDQEEIMIRKVDSIFKDFCNKESNVMMKIDTQGFEKNVIDGASESLSKIRVIQLEMAIAPLYENEMLFVDMSDYLINKGFRLASLENGFADWTTGQLLQVDGIFVQQDFL